MKIRIFCLIVICCLTHPLVATPDHAVTVTERFLGSNPTGFAILRTESDNMCSYYSSRVTTWLDEIPKSFNGREKMQSTLLLDVTRTLDAAHSDPNTSVPVVEKINSQNAALTLASVLQRYSDQMQPWTPEQIAKLKIDPIAGISSGRKLVLINGSTIGERIFGGRHADEGWALKEITEDKDSIYLRLSMGQDEGGPHTRIVCVSPEITKRQRDQATAQPVYLTTGKFDNLDQAIQSARALVEKKENLKLYNFHPEIWSLEDGTSTIKYVIAEKFSTELIKSGDISHMESALEIQVTPMSSDRFIERTKVSN